jgi:hypothetical protein
MRRIVLGLALAGCTGGGEGGGDVEATVALRSTTCELTDPMTSVTSATIDVFMRGNLHLRASASPILFPGDRLMTTGILSCGAWMADAGGCIRRAGDPARTTVEFTSTANLDEQPPAFFEVRVGAAVTDDVGDVFAEDSLDVECR